MVKVSLLASVHVEIKEIYIILEASSSFKLLQLSRSACTRLASVPC